MTTRAALVALALLVAVPSATAATVYRVDRVTDGDTIVLRNGQRVRLVQIDTPEVFFGLNCYGREASAAHPPSTPAADRLFHMENATDIPQKIARADLGEF